MTINPTTELENPFGDFSALITAHAANQPERIALDDGDEVLSWAEVDTLTNRIAAQMQADGLQKGQAVAILGITTVRYALVYLAAIRGGRVRCAADHIGDASAACRDDGGCRCDASVC